MCQVGKQGDFSEGWPWKGPHRRHLMLFCRKKKLWSLVLSGGTEIWGVSLAQASNVLGLFVTFIKVQGL